MKCAIIDAAFPGLLSLFAGGCMVHSATGGEQITVFFLAIMLAGAAFITGWVFAVWRVFLKRPVKPAILCASASLAVIISVAATNWPLRVAYAMSRDGFDALAQQIRTGDNVSTPVRSGLFVVRQAELSRNGIVCLWTHPNPSGSTGFVQCPRDHVPFNLWSIVRLDDNWQFISED